MSLREELQAVVAAIDTRLRVIEDAVDEIMEDLDSLESLLDDGQLDGYDDEPEEAEESANDEGREL
jgi:hypothetical protein